MKTLSIAPAALVLLFAATSAQASAGDFLTLEDLQDQSALVVLGEVTDTNTQTSGGQVVTNAEIRVIDCLTGLCPEDVIVTNPGHATEGSPRFEEGREVLVFLRPDNGHFVVVGMAQGLFHIEGSGDEAVAVSDRSGMDLRDHSGRPSLVERVAYPLAELVDGIRLGLPVDPVAQN